MKNNKLKLTETESILMLALQIIANGDPISIGFDEIKEFAQNAIDRFEELKKISNETI